MNKIKTSMETLDRGKKAELLMSTVVDMAKGYTTNETGVFLFFSGGRSNYFPLHEELPEWEYRKRWLQLV